MSENMEHMGKIACAVLDDPALGDIAFDEFSVVFGFEDDGFCSGNFGYAYSDEGEPVPFALDGNAAENAASAYWSFLKSDDDRGASKMLFQFNKNTRRVNAEFAYGDTKQWKVTPKNLDTIVETLRPNLGQAQ